MKFTDIFIKRPVLATVISILIFILGLKAIFELPLRQFPKLTNTVITISTAYPGANAELIQGFITAPIQKAVAGADGIDYISATSTNNVSMVKVYIRLNYDPDKALTEIMGKVAQAKDSLPRSSNDPVVEKDTGDTLALMYIGFNSPNMTTSQTTDYLTRVVQPKLETVPGVASAEIRGGTQFAMRIWLDPKKMAALGVTADDVNNALTQNNFQSAAGSTKGEYVVYTLNAQTDLQDIQAFEKLVIKHNNNAFVRIRDVAKVELGSENYDSQVNFDGSRAVFMGIFSTPSANPLDVIRDVRALLPQLSKDYPPGMTGQVVYDSTKFIKESIHEVIKTILEATAIVVLVIFLFLGAFRTVMIPIVTIPLSLIGVASVMLMFGYSLNTLTLLAMVLAIGLVVDDAIIVVENVYRHIEEGQPPRQAALNGAREIAIPIITMTLTLACVYAPIGFMQGITGALFTEFAFTLAFAVMISGIIALTLSPMMCSKVLNHDVLEKPFVKRVDRVFENLKQRYAGLLKAVLDTRPVALLFAAVVLISCGFLFVTTQSELAPAEDKGVLFSSITAPDYASLNYLMKYTRQVEDVYRTIPEKKQFFMINGMGATNNAISGLILKEWSERDRTQEQVKKEVQQKFGQIAGVNAVIFGLPPLPGNSGGLPVQFVLTTTASSSLLYQVATQMLKAAQSSGNFMFVDSSLKFNKPEISVQIDRNKAAELGVTMQQLGATLSTLLGEQYVNRFGYSGQSYQVIPQVSDEFRRRPESLYDYYVKSTSGQMVSLATLIKLKRTVSPNQLEQFQQLNSATIQGVVMPGKTIADALNFMRNQAQELLPQGFSYDFAGQSRQYIEEGNSMVYTFVFAMLIIFLVLAAQFESFTDPLIILISVPMSICGALIPLNLGLATINIYTQIGLVTLIGLISKHGILMVDFANHLQASEGLSIREAIEKAAGMRLRPILMTTISMVFGVLPLLMAGGAGAASRFDIGLVIASGMTIGTLFTIFMVPTMYTLLARHHHAPEVASE